jgi:hypothetical protein
MDQTQSSTPQPQIPAEIRGFLEGILQDAQMLYTDDSMHEEMLQELYARLDAFITGAIVDALADDQLETFIQMNEEKKPRADIEAYIKQVLPNAQEVFTNAFMDFRDLYLGGVKIARDAPREQKNDIAPPPPPETAPADTDGRKDVN